MDRCCVCRNAAFDQYPKASLCLPCLRTWSQFQQKTGIDTRTSEQFEEAISAEFTGQLKRTDPTLARKISSVLAGGDQAPDFLAKP